MQRIRLKSLFLVIFRDHKLQNYEKSANFRESEFVILRSCTLSFPGDVLKIVVGQSHLLCAGETKQVQGSPWATYGQVCLELGVQVGGPQKLSQLFPKQHP